MSEKEKHKAKPASQSHILVFLVKAILALPLLCGACFGLINASDYIQMHECFNETEPIEWNGLIDYEAEEENPVISQANLSELSLLPYYPDESIFPTISKTPSISHPAIDYFLTSRKLTSILTIPIYVRPELVLCQPNGWARDVLSYNVYGYRFSPDGNNFALISDMQFQDIELYDAETIELLSTVRIPTTTIVTPTSSFAFHPTEPLIAIFVYETEATSLYFWNYESKEDPIRVFTGDIGGFNTVAFNEDGTLLMANRRETEVTEAATFVWGIPPE